MGSFLDKVGLQHFVEKVKNLLSGYLPLSGGIIGGGQSYLDISNDNLHMYYSGEYADYELVKNMNCNLKQDGLYVSVQSSNFNGNATFNAQKCEVQKFVLTKKEAEGVGYVVEQEGLLANDSEEVVKELSDDQVLKILNENDASFITGKHYLSEKGLSKLATLVCRNNKTIIQTDMDTKIHLPEENLEYPIPAYTNYCIDFATNWSINDPDHIISMICRGFINIDGFNGLEYIKTFDARDSYLYNDDLSYLFAYCSYLTNVDIADWNTNKVTNMSNMFSNCEALQSLILNHWDTSKVTNMSYMFDSCTSLSNLNLDGWNTSNVTKMSNMFSNCEALQSLILNHWDTSKVTKMNYMFSNCTSLSNLNLDGWDTSNVTDMFTMFNNCTSLSNLNLDGWNTSKVTDMSYMFCVCIYNHRTTKTNQKYPSVNL